MARADESGLMVARIRVQSWLITGSLGVNVLLFVMKFYVLIQSNSVSVLSSVVDSGLDLFSGLVIFLVAVFMRKRNRYLYPMGKGRFDALATIVIASVMVTAAVELIRRAIEEIATDSADAELDTCVGHTPAARRAAPLNHAHDH